MLNDGEHIQHSTFNIQHSPSPPYNNSPMPRLPALALALFVAACATPSLPPTQPNDREWSLLGADYAWIESLRKAQVPPPPNASRKQMIEVTLANLQKIQAPLDAFM